MKTLHLVCNAHLDPVWQWEWEEGAAEAISTFRVAADFCEEHDGFIFNHNEVILYEWVEKYEPALFSRIQRLVRQGKWHIMGGWFIQPDCNMPSGESFVRQILHGRYYFRSKFNREPTTAINFDPFGHTRGLVQIMKKAGYDSYLFCRPQPDHMELPENDFTWVGFDGSEVTGHRAFSMYLSRKGKAAEKISDWLEAHPDKEVGMVLWGIGNHGGGPSREDLENIEKLMKKHRNEIMMRHSTPEEYFTELRTATEKSGKPLPRVERDLNPWGVGCYTSQVRIKQKHRQLENLLFQTEKMAGHAAMAGLVNYPGRELEEAGRDLMFSQFHDILPGSSIQQVEEWALNMMGHGLEILQRIRARLFFALCNGQPKAIEGELPMMVYNPHPYPVEEVVTVEFQLPDINWSDKVTIPDVYKDGKKVPAQLEKEEGNLPVDWRKRIVFRDVLEPGTISRYDCRMRMEDTKPPHQVKESGDCFVLETDDCTVTVNKKTGLIDSYEVDGVSFLKPGAFKPLVIEDSEDPWGSLVHGFKDIAGSFQLMGKEKGTWLSAVSENALESVRVIEDGEVRTIIESLFEYNSSYIVLRYGIPKQGSELEVSVRCFLNEKDRLLKLSIPTVFEKGTFLGQVAFGRQELPANGDEAVAQKWTAVASKKRNAALTCINVGTYGSSFTDGELRPTILRSPAYAALPVRTEDRRLVVQDRFSPRIDQGERLFTFWIKGGPYEERMEKIDREAQARNEKPFALSFYPSGQGRKPEPFAVVDDEVVVVSAFKQSLETMKGVREDAAYILRLHEPTGNQRSATVRFPFLDIQETVELKPFEVKTFEVSPSAKTIKEVSIIEDI